MFPCPCHGYPQALKNTHSRKYPSCRIKKPHPMISDPRHPTRHETAMTHTTPLFPTGQKKYASSRLTPQGQALRVAAHALTDQPRLHKEWVRLNKGTQAVTEIVNV